jgi:hypothetical protein
MAASKQTLSDFQSVLGGIAGLAALVGGRIYASQPPQGAPLPTLTVHVIASPTDYTHDGHGLDETVVQLDIDAATQTACRDVADAVLDGIGGKTITAGGTDFEAIFHDGVEITSVSDSLVPGTTQAHRLSVDYRLLHRPAFAQV